MKNLRIVALSICLLLVILTACGGTNSQRSTDGDGEISEFETVDGDATPDGDQETESLEADRDVGLLRPPLLPSDDLGYDLPSREPDGTAPSQAEIDAFTKKTSAFFKDTHFFDWLWRMTHGLDASYGNSMMPYKLWWQDTRVIREGDTIVFSHVGRAENILKRSVKVMVAASSAYQLTGEARMAELAEQLMNGVVALSLGMEFTPNNPKAKYLQARAVFNHNHSYTVDGRKVRVDYTPMYWDETHENWYKWNVQVFEIPNNPTYGQVWVSNMRSKDDVPYLFSSIEPIARLYHTTDNQALRQAAERYIEYVRGFSQSIVDNDWFMLTAYRDGTIDIARDYTKESDGEHPPADLGSFVHWTGLFGPDAECTAQLGSVLTGYGIPGEKGDCGGASPSSPGWRFERYSFATNYFNYNIYTYFHIGALTAAHTWGYPKIGKVLMKGLAERFDEIRKGTTLQNRDNDEFQTDLAGWLLAAAAQGYPLTAAEARHVMEWYATASDWYRQWPHWDPWSSLKDGESLDDFVAPRNETISDGQGGTKQRYHIRQDEMAYLFEYCASPLRDKGVRFIDCSVLADPVKWGK